MSQFYVGISDGNLPPDVPLDFHTPNGDAIPANNIINFYANQTQNNVDVGIDVSGSGNTVTYVLTNRTTGSFSQNNVGPNALMSFAFVQDGGYFVYGNVVGYSTNLDPGGITPGAIAISFTGGFRVTGGVLIELGVEYHDTFQETAISTADIVLSANGNNATLYVSGIAGKTISWNGMMEYRKA